MASLGGGSMGGTGSTTSTGTSWGTSLGMGTTALASKKKKPAPTVVTTPPANGSTPDSGGGPGMIWNNRTRTWKPDPNYRPPTFAPQPAPAPTTIPYSPAYTPGSTITNTTTPSPGMTAWKGQLAERSGMDDTKRQIENAQLSAADTVALMQKQARGGLSQRGALGSGVEAAMSRNLANAGMRQANQATQGILTAEAARKDALLGLGLSGEQAASGQDIANRQLALGQTTAIGNLEMQRAQLAQQEAQRRADEQARQQAQWLALMQMYQ